MFLPMRRMRQDWDPIDIIAALRKGGFTLRGLDREHGLKPNTMVRALRMRRPECETIIADALRVSASRIWPTRYRKKSGR